MSHFNMNRQRRFCPVPQPEPTNSDVVSSMADDVLLARIKKLEEDMQRVAASNFPTIPWEVEMCYLQREQFLRNVRHVRHEEYMRNAWRRNSAEFDEPTPAEFPPRWYSFKIEPSVIV